MILTDTAKRLTEIMGPAEPQSAIEMRQVIIKAFKLTEAYSVGESMTMIHLENEKCRNSQIRSLLNRVLNSRSEWLAQRHPMSFSQFLDYLTDEQIQNLFAELRALAGESSPLEVDMLKIE